MVPEQVDRARGTRCGWHGYGCQPLVGAGVQQSEFKDDEESRVAGAAEQKAGRDEGLGAHTGFQCK